MRTILVQMVAMAKQDDWVRLTVRLPPDVHARLSDAVAVGANSMNAEIVERLQFSFTIDDLGKRPAAAEEQMALRTSYEVTRREMENTKRQLAEIAETLARVEGHMRERGMQVDD